MSPKKLLKRFEIKSHHRRALYLYLARNNDSKLAVGVAPPRPLPLLGLNQGTLRSSLYLRVSFDDGQWCSKAAAAAAVVHNT